MESPVKDQLMAVAANIRYERLSKKYSQQHVANLAGLSQNAYSRIECGFSKIPLDAFLKIAKVLDKPVKELLKVGVYL